MQISARLDEAFVREMVGELLPLTILLDEEDGIDRWIRIDPARSVDFVADEGLRLEVSGQLRWKMAGVPLLLTITTAHLLLRPSVVVDGDGGRLVFLPSLEKMDLKNIPGFVDDGIAAMINRQLAGEADRLCWRFGETLKSRFVVGSELVEIESFDVGAGNGRVNVTSDAIVFALDLAMRFVRKSR